jgi:NitT/TauT family transport system substrate-binding protein
VAAGPVRDSDHTFLASMAAFVGLKPATDITWIDSSDPEALRLFAEGYAERYDYILQALQEIPYNQWREYDPEDTVRFHALRLHEAGMIKTSPQKIITQGTDWRFLHALKKEMKT